MGAGGIKNITTRIIQTLAQIMKSTGDVVKFEREAAEASKIMEEATINANIAKNNMITMSEKARLIAKTSIVDRNPCNPQIMPCDFPSPIGLGGASDFLSQKVFPREVGDIKEFMNDTFSTNINGFTG